MKVVMIGDDPYSCTGFATVIKELFSNMHAHEKTIIAFGQMREKYTVKGMVDGRPNSFTVYSTMTWAGVRALLLELKPDVVIIYGAFWHLERYRSVIRSEPPFKEILYIVVDTPDPPKKILPFFNTFDMVLTPSNSSTAMLREVDINSKVLYHGVNTKLFTPAEKEKEGMFIYGQVAKNNIRKALNRLVKAFELVNNSSILKIYTNPYDDKGYRIDEMSRNINMEERIRFYDTSLYKIGRKQSDMVDIYREWDIGVYAGCGESYYLPGAEAGGCGIGHIVTDLPVFHEILGEGALYAKVKTKEYTHFGTLSLVDIEDFADKMMRVYESDSLKKKLGKKAREQALKFTWAEASAQLDNYIIEVSQ